MLGADYLYCGLSWTPEGQWEHELIDESGEVRKFDGADRRLSFRVTSDDRHCTGYFVFENGTSYRTPCPEGHPVARGKQCSQCRYREGFATVHNARRGFAGLAP